jgi:hypothetical protein
MGHKLVSYCILGQFALHRTKAKKTDDQTLFQIGRNELLCRMVSNPEPIGTPAKQKQKSKGKKGKGRFPENSTIKKGKSRNKREAKILQ